MRINSFIKPIILSVFLCCLTACALTVPTARVPRVEPPVTYLYKLHPQVILVLGSGSTRGFAHAGVLKVLEENHIPIDMIVGTSAGSIVGSLYADNPSANRLIRLIFTTPRYDVIDFSISNIRQGIITGSKLQEFLNRQLHAHTFERLTIPFVAIATNLQTGKMHMFGSGPIAPAVNASSAVPPFFQPVKLYGSTYIDGAFVDPVAVDVAKSFHPKLIIAVNLNYRLSNEMPTNSPSVFLRAFDMMLLRLNDYSAAQAQVVITPMPNSVGMFDGSMRGELIKSGEIAARQAIPRIKELLAKDGIALAKN